MAIFNVKAVNWQVIADAVKANDLEKAKRMTMTALTNFTDKLASRPIAEVIKLTTAPDPGGQGDPRTTDPFAHLDYEPDRGYEVMFGEQDLTTSTNDTYEVKSTAGVITYKQKKPGQPVELSSLPKVTSADVKMIRLGGGFAVEDDWLRFNKFYEIERLYMAATRDWFNQKAELFYGLLKALPAGVNIAYSSDVVSTMNKAFASIINALKAKKQAIGANSGFVITCNPNERDLIGQALAARYTNPNTNNKQLTSTIKAVVASAYMDPGECYVSIPGYNCERLEWDPFHFREAKRNELHLGAEHVQTGAYNGHLSEQDAHRRVALS